MKLKSTYISLSILFLCLFTNASWANEEKTISFWTNFFSSIECIVIIIALCFIWWQIRLQRLANMISSFETLDLQWESTEMRRARKRLCSKYLKGEKNVDRIDGLVLGFFEDLALYLEKRVYNLETVWTKYSQDIDYYWAVLEPSVQDLRKSQRDKTYYEKFENLYKTIKKKSQKKGIPVDKKSKKELTEFAQTEIKYIEDLIKSFTPTTP